MYQLFYNDVCFFSERAYTFYISKIASDFEFMADF